MLKNITLIGFQASGKSTLGKRLGERLGRTFIDTDAWIEEVHKPLTCGQIHTKFGEVYFRSLESQLLHQAEKYENSIIAVGGGSLLLEINGISLKKHSLLYYLKTPQDIIKERIWSRPFLPSYLQTDKPEELFNKIFNQRKVLYERWADKVIDMEEFTFEQAIDPIICLTNNLPLIGDFYPSRYSWRS